MVSTKYQGQNYKVNNKIKKAVDKNQLNYRESEDDPIPFIKRVFVYVTDKKGKVLEDVILKFQDKEISIGRNGLLLSNLPNEDAEITAEKEGYKTATGHIILNANIQTHDFYLALSTSDEESEVISTDNTIEPQKEDDFVKGSILFQPELNGSDQITSWAGDNKTESGEYICHGSYLTEGWSNEGLWELEYDVKYSKDGVYSYVGIMPICSEEINPFTDEKNNKYSLSAWEAYACVKGLGSTIIGPNNYKYLLPGEYHHTIIRKIAEDTIIYIFDNKEWKLIVPELKNLTLLHIGARDNPANVTSRNIGEQVYYKNIKVTELIPKDSQKEINNNSSNKDDEASSTETSESTPEEEPNHEP